MKGNGGFQCDFSLSLSMSDNNFLNFTLDNETAIFAGKKMIKKKLAIPHGATKYRKCNYLYQNKWLQQINYTNFHIYWNDLQDITDIMLWDPASAERAEFCTCRWR